MKQAYPPSPDGMPPQGVRTALSFFLFIHLFVVVCAVTTYANPSPLQQRLREVLAPYTHTLNFDLNHPLYGYSRFHLTDGPGEVDYSLHITADQPNSPSLDIPAGGLWPPQRWRRHQKMANVAGSLVASEGADSLMPRSITMSFLGQADAKRGSVKITAHDLPLVDSYQSAQISKRDPADPSYYRTVFDALVMANGDVLKRSAAAEVAPVDKRSARKKPAE